jgi:hypothetical protein
MLALLIVTVIGVGPPGVPRHPRPLHNATVLVQPIMRNPPPSYPPPIGRKTDKRGRAEIRLAPGRYEVLAVLENSSPPLRCQSRTVTMTGDTQKVRLSCHR